MLLIDSIYVNAGGGLCLLRYLVDKLKYKGVDFFLLADVRAAQYFKEVTNKEALYPSLFERHRFYNKNKTKWSAVLCFGNMPPTVKMLCPVYTYFHNINLLTLQQITSIRHYCINWVKRQLFICFRKNTDYWVVQTSNTYAELKKNLREQHERILIFPFFYIPEELKDCRYVKGRTDYVLIGDYYVGGKGHDALIAAWSELSAKGYVPTLHLTVNKKYTAVLSKIEDANNKGADIRNHGTISFDEVISLYKSSKALIYPSHNESFGLGLVEAVHAGCKILASDLPFTYAVVKPSIVFNPYDVSSIVEAVIQFENQGAPESLVCIEDQVDALIDKISKDINS